MSNHSHINAAVLGFGFMGRTHAKCYQDAQADCYPVTLAAIADANLKDLNQPQTAGNIDTDQHSINTENISFFSDAQSLISDPSINLVSICTHTESHVDLAIEALNAGKHVLVEKPIAINPDDVQRLVEAAQRSNTLCIPAMCMRHWPAWTTIHELVTTNKYNQLELGPLRSAAFHRLGSRPTWGADFYKDQSRSGGVLHDLHIHDTDFIFHCFGKPTAVTTTGDPLHLTTLYHYDTIPHVTAQGAWDQQPSAGFQMKCTINFQSATLDFDLSRDPQLILHHADESTPIETSSLTGFDCEIRWIIDQITSNTHSTKPIQDAVAVSQILRAEQQSMSSNQPVSVS
jgi:predicted dehydrogenase